MTRLDSTLVLKYAKKARTFSTDDVAAHFCVGKMQAAAAIAVLRGRNSLYRANPDKNDDGSSRWTVRAPKH